MAEIIRNEKDEVYEFLDKLQEVMEPDEFGKLIEKLNGDEDFRKDFEDLVKGYEEEHEDELIDHCFGIEFDELFKIIEGETPEKEEEKEIQVEEPEISEQELNPEEIENNQEEEIEKNQAEEERIGPESKQVHAEGEQERYNRAHNTTEDMTHAVKEEVEGTLAMHRANGVSPDLQTVTDEYIIDQMQNAYAEMGGQEQDALKVNQLEEAEIKENKTLSKMDDYFEQWRKDDMYIQIINGRPETMDQYKAREIFGISSDTPEGEEQAKEIMKDYHELLNNYDPERARQDQELKEEQQRQMEEELNRRPDDDDYEDTFYINS